MPKPKAAPPATPLPAPAPDADAASAPRKRKAPQELAPQRLHPVQVEFSYPVGVRVDMDRELPIDLSDEDPEELLETFSSPPVWEDRLAPVTTTFNQEKVTGKNPLEVELKFLHRFTNHLGHLATEMERTNKARFGERGAVSFMGLGLDPDTVVRIIDYDYETADNTYSRIVTLFATGSVTPVGTTPFHTLLPLYKHDFEVRLLVRIGLDFYWPLFKKYNRAHAKNTGEKYFLAVFWLPEGAYSARVLQVLHQEFVRRCEAESISPAHLVLLLDTDQSRESEVEVLMKRWNTIRPAPTTRDTVTVMFREPAFTDWVIMGHPSTKKQLDRTIAKVDAVLRDNGKDHLWAHFEPLGTLLSTFKTCNNFEQKLLKLTELGYQPCGPDVFVRRKLLEIHGMAEEEPRRTLLHENSCWGAWVDGGCSLSRFTGVEDTYGIPGAKPALAPNRPYTRRVIGGTSRMEVGSQCWKPALRGALSRVHRAVVGEPKTFMGGMLGILREITPLERIPTVMRNIEDFLVLYARIRWKEHYVHNVCSEADIQLAEFAREALLKDPSPEDGEPELEDERIIAAGAAAEAIYLAHEGLASTGLAWENLDQRATYQVVAMMSLAVVHAIRVLNWMERPEEGQALFKVFQEELLDFEKAYTRHEIDKLGVDRKTWDLTIRSQVEDSPLNVVSRAARRIGAKYLRNAGFRAHFERNDEFTSTTTGHIWSHEVEHENMVWENDVFCGLTEE